MFGRFFHDEPFPPSLLTSLKGMKMSRPEEGFAVYDITTSKKTAANVRKSSERERGEETSLNDLVVLASSPGVNSVLTFAAHPKESGKTTSATVRAPTRSSSSASQVTPQRRVAAAAVTRTPTSSPSPQRHRQQQTTGTTPRTLNTNPEQTYRRLLEKGTEYQHRLTTLRASRDAAQLEECTFSPRTNKNKDTVGVINNTSSSPPASTRRPSSVPPSVCERLHGVKDAYTRNRALLQAQRAEEERRDATFHPAINGNTDKLVLLQGARQQHQGDSDSSMFGSSLAPSFSSPFLDRVNAWEHQRKCRQQQHEQQQQQDKQRSEEQNDAACTFTPRINKLSSRIADTKKETTASDYLSTSAVSAVGSNEVNRRLYEEGLLQHQRKNNKSSERVLVRGGARGVTPGRIGGGGRNTTEQWAEQQSTTKAASRVGPGEEEVFRRLVRDNEAREVMRTMQDERLRYNNNNSTTGHNGSASTSASSSLASSPARTTTPKHAHRARQLQQQEQQQKNNNNASSEYTLLLSELNKRRLAQKKQQQQEQEEEEQEKQEENERREEHHVPRYATPIKRKDYHQEQEQQQGQQLQSEEGKRTRRHQLGVVHAWMEKEKSRRLTLDRKRAERAQLEEQELASLQQHNNNDGTSARTKKRRVNQECEDGSRSCSSNTSCASSTNTNSSTNSGFYASQLQWKMTLERTLERKRAERRAAEERNATANCTFSPTLSSRTHNDGKVRGSEAK